MKKKLCQKKGEKRRTSMKLKWKMRVHKFSVWIECNLIGANKRNKCTIAVCIIALSVVINCADTNVPYFTSTNGKLHAAGA